MRYFMSIVPSRDYEAGKPVPPQLMEAMGPFIEQTIASGMLISTAGLKRSDTAVQLTTNEGRVMIVDGPYSEAKEVIGGYAVIEAASKGDAIKMASDFVMLHVDNGMPDIRVEIREIDGGFNY